MPICPECDTDLDLDEEEIDEGDIISCKECGTDFEVVRNQFCLRAGHQAADRLFAARREGLRELLADWSPDEYAELGELLTRLSRALLGENADRHLIGTKKTDTEKTGTTTPGAGA